MKIYVITIKEKDLEHATDMLRYDAAFEACKLDEETWEICTCLYTPKRWASFGIGPDKLKVKSRTESGQHEAFASGFTRGVRFAQRFLKGRDYKVLMEDYH